MSVLKQTTLALILALAACGQEALPPAPTVQPAIVHRLNHAQSIAVQNDSPYPVTYQIVTPNCIPWTPYGGTIPAGGYQLFQVASPQDFFCSAELAVSDGYSSDECILEWSGGTGLFSIFPGDNTNCNYENLPVTLYYNVTNRHV